MKKIRSKINQENALILIANLFFIIFVISSNQTVFFADSNQYWEFGKDIISADGFNLTGYDASLRSYLFPLFLGLVNFLADILHINPIYTIQVAQGFLFILVLVKFLPKFYLKLFVQNGSKKILQNINSIQIAVILLLFFVFWRGYLLFPLSDFPSALLFLASLYYLIDIEKEEKKKRIKNIILSGVCLGAAAIIRPIYEYAGYLIFIYIFYLKFFKKLEITISGFIMGFIIPLLPQLYINYKLYDKFNPFSNSDQLLIFQLKIGLQIQKFQAFFGAAQIYINPAYKYIDASTIVDIPSYIKFTFNNFAFSTLTYLKKLFNVFDMNSSEPYIMNAGIKSFLFLSALNFTVLFLAICQLLKSRLNNARKFFIFLIILPVLLSCTGAVELRFSLTFTILLYSIFAFGVTANYKNFLNYKMFAIFVLFILSTTALSYSTIITCQTPIFLNTASTRVYYDNKNYELADYTRDIYYGKFPAKNGSAYKFIIQTGRSISSQEFYINITSQPTDKYTNNTFEMKMSAFKTQYEAVIQPNSPFTEKPAQFRIVNRSLKPIEIKSVAVYEMVVE